MGLRTYFRQKRRKWLMKMLPELGGLIEQGAYYFNDTKCTRLSPKCKIYPPYHLYDCKVGDYTYISMNARISMAEIGKFCSIGPNFVCGHGMHPTDGMKQNGTTLSHKDKVRERERIRIGNDVFIGMGVTVLDGVTIGDGAIIGAGAVVSKDIPPYAIAVGCPIRVVRYRFNEETVRQFLDLKWWDKGDDCLHLVEKHFLHPTEFLKAAQGMG